MTTRYFFPIAAGLALLLAFTGCNDDDDGAMAPATPSVTNPPLPTTIAGVSANLEFTTANAGAPYQLNDEVLFTFANNGEMTIDEDPNANNGPEVTVSAFMIVGSEYVWEDATNGYKYALSLMQDSSINEVNVSDLSNNFLGQFTPIGAGTANLSLVQALAGNYTVATVTSGTHSRMTVAIDHSGDIDFDDNTAYVAADYALITDRLNVLDGIWIDITPYPAEPYPRFQLFVVSGTQQLERIVYYPQYPNSSGKVEVTVN